MNGYIFLVTDLKNVNHQNETILQIENFNITLVYNFRIFFLFAAVDKVHCMEMLSVQCFYTDHAQTTDILLFHVIALEYMKYMCFGYLS